MAASKAGINNDYLLPNGGNTDNPLFNSSLRKRPSNSRDSLPLPCFNSDWIGVGECGTSSRRTNYSPFKDNYSSGGGGTRNSLLSLLTFLLFGGALVYAGVSAHVSSLHEALALADAEKVDLRAAHGNVVHELVVANKALSGMKRTYESMKTSNHQMSEAMRQIRTDYHLGAEERVHYAGQIQELEEEMSKKMQQAELRTTAAREREEALKDRVQEGARTEVKRLFGAGPYQVEMELEIPVEASSADTRAGTPPKTVTRTIDIQMAPMEFMPHSVHTFLTQVDRKAWNGAQFDLHGGHVLQAHRAAESELPPSSSEEELDSERSIGVGFAKSVFFREFSNKFPHVKYTMAFNGGSLGSAMYINVDNNHEHHRPVVGVDGKEMPETGEPCFGNIIVGQDVVDMMDALKVNSVNSLVNPVIIKKATVKR